LPEQEPTENCECNNHLIVSMPAVPMWRVHLLRAGAASPLQRTAGPFASPTRPVFPWASADSGGRSPGEGGRSQGASVVGLL